MSGACDFQQCDILRSVDSDKPVQSPIELKSCSASSLTSEDPEGGGAGGPDPPGKLQVVWVSIGNTQLDPPPGKSWTPPPPGKCWTPLGTLKNDRIL